ncbi:MAG: hypothetical protein WDN27_00730 [Candidatus Saccharibacteria bacterium]
MKKLLTILASPIIALSMLGSVAHAAGTAAFTLSLPVGSYTNGSSFTVQVHENGTSVNVVTAKLTYDSTKLACTATIGSAFTSVVSSCVAGAATFSGYPNFDASGNHNYRERRPDRRYAEFYRYQHRLGSRKLHISLRDCKQWRKPLECVTTSGNYTITAASSQPSGGSTARPAGNTARLAAPVPPQYWHEERFRLKGFYWQHRFQDRFYRHRQHFYGQNRQHRF